MSNAKNVSKKASNVCVKSSNVRNVSKKPSNVCMKPSNAASQAPPLTGRELLGRVRLAERLLKQEPIPKETLQAMTSEQLQELADRLEAQLSGHA